MPKLQKVDFVRARWILEKLGHWEVALETVDATLAICSLGSSERKSLMGVRDALEFLRPDESTGDSGE